MSSLDDPTVLIGIEVIIRENVISWFDTVRERMMKVGCVISETSGEFVFERVKEEGGGTYTFIPLSLDIYRTKVKSHTASREDFETEEDLFLALETTKKYAW